MLQHEAEYRAISREYGMDSQPPQFHFHFEKWLCCHSSFLCRCAVKATGDGGWDIVSFLWLRGLAGQKQYKYSSMAVFRTGALDSLFSQFSLITRYSNIPPISNVFVESFLAYALRRGGSCQPIPSAPPRSTLAFRLPAWRCLWPRMAVPQFRPKRCHR